MLLKVKDVSKILADINCLDKSCDTRLAVSDAVAADNYKN